MIHVYIFITSVFVLCLYKTLYTNALSVEVSGLLGENGTQIECSYSKENVFKIDVVYIVVFNRGSLKFESIAEYFPNLNPSLTPTGQFLSGRVTLLNITQSSTKAVLIFIKNKCRDDTFYRCVVRFTDSSLKRKEETSSNISISIQASPSKPKSIILLKQQTGIKRTSTPAITDGDDVTFVCSGNVGKPPANFQFQMIRSGDTLYMNYTDTNSFIKELLVSDDCSYTRTSYITFKVTAEDNQSVMRCTAASRLSEGCMYVESEPLDVNYAVKIPTIVKHPNKGDYLVGLDTSITLNCTTDGNPKPRYAWYKDNVIEAISTSDFLTITNITTSNSGLYTCFVSNTFNGVNHTERVQLHVSILKQEIEENQTSSTTFSTTVNVINKTTLLKQSSVENTAVIAVGAVCGSILLVLCVILFGVIQNKNKCLLMRSRNDRSVDYVNTTQQQNPSLYEVVDSALDIHNYEQLSRREHIYEDTNF